ncbi:MAG: flagellar biosynthesis anti-sigma factor FlgM [Lachnospiraceae bacterium]|nr:flagellar biosynthesis anti-sigma factor FlgM [Lachnospiraceae bacterium]
MRIEAYSQIQNLYNVSKPAGKTEPNVMADFRDKLHISESGRDLQVAKKAVSEAADIRADRVNAIKSAYESGLYNVSANEFAEKVMSNYAQTL